MPGANLTDYNHGQASKEGIKKPQSILMYGKSIAPTSSIVPERMKKHLQ